MEGEYKTEEISNINLSSKISVTNNLDENNGDSVNESLNALINLFLDSYQEDKDASIREIYKYMKQNIYEPPDFSTEISNFSIILFDIISKSTVPKRTNMALYMLNCICSNGSFIDHLNNEIIEPAITKIFSVNGNYRLVTDLIFKFIDHGAFTNIFEAIGYQHLISKFAERPNDEKMAPYCLYGLSQISHYNKSPEFQEEFFNCISITNFFSTDCLQYIISILTDFAESIDFKQDLFIDLVLDAPDAKNVLIKALKDEYIKIYRLPDLFVRLIQKENTFRDKLPLDFYKDIVFSNEDLSDNIIENLGTILHLVFLADEMNKERAEVIHEFIRKYFDVVSIEVKEVFSMICIDILTIIANDQIPTDLFKECIDDIYNGYQIKCVSLEFICYHMCSLIEKLKTTGQIDNLGILINSELCQDIIDAAEEIPEDQSRKSIQSYIQIYDEVNNEVNNE